MKSAVIAGTGVYQIPGVEFTPQRVETPYGPAQVYCGTGEYENLVFLARHGVDHSTPPHAINYQANLKALEMLGVQKVIAINAVGSISREVPPGGVAIVNDFLDFTSGRPLSYYNGGESGVAHTDMSHPYCPSLQAALAARAEEFGLKPMQKAVYVSTNGPRFETPAEIRMYKTLGGDVVGMTGVPEVNLAKELKLHYAAVAYSINWAVGVEEDLGFVSGNLGDLKQRLVQWIVSVLMADPALSCACESALMVMQPNKTA